MAGPESKTDQQQYDILLEFDLVLLSGYSNQIYQNSQLCPEIKLERKAKDRLPPAPFAPHSQSVAGSLWRKEVS